MEVHHHASHSPKKRGWKTYFWEFVMLFLAVFCGSLAEYQLEHKIERDRESQYIKSLLVDLAADTTNLGKAISKFNTYEQRLDTVLTRFDNLSVGFDLVLFNNLAQIAGYVDFINTDRTMQQLKNSGAMRLVVNLKAANAIMDYDSQMRHLMNTGQPIIKDLLLRDLLPILFRTVDFKAVNYDLIHKSEAELKRENKTFLLQNDRAKLGEFNNYLQCYKALCSSIKEDERDLKKQAAQLLVLLKKEYDLE